MDTLVLGGDPGVTVMHFDNYTTKAAKEARDAAENPILLKNYNRCVDAAGSIRDQLPDDVSEMLMKGEIKQRLFDGLKTTEPDIVYRDAVLDLKRSKVTPTDYKWQRHAHKMRYDLAVGAAIEMTGANRYGWLVVEADWPHCAVVHWATDSYIRTAVDTWRMACDRWFECVITNEFPAYESGEIDLYSWQLDDGSEGFTFTEDSNDDS